MKRFLTTEKIPYKVILCLQFLTHNFITLRKGLENDENPERESSLFSAIANVEASIFKTIFQRKFNIVG